MVLSKEEKIEKLKKLKKTLLELRSLAKIYNAFEISRSRRFAVRPLNRDGHRNGFYVAEFLKHKEEDSEEFFKYTKMNRHTYDILLNLIQPHLMKNASPIQPECRLAVLLFYLSQGATIQILSWAFKMGKATVRSIILETSEIIWNVLSELYVTMPNHDDYVAIADGFWNLWGMPNCIGALDGKHIDIKCPSKWESQERFHSIVLLAACDHKCRFTHIDLGAYGDQRDGGIFEISDFGTEVLGNTLPIPQPKALPATEILSPHFFIGDDAFPLAINIMRPFTDTDLPSNKENYNKKLSIARKTIENAFGILVTRWRVLLSTLHMFPENAKKVVLCCIALHNFIMSNSDYQTSGPNSLIDWEDIDGNWQDGTWRAEVNTDMISIKPSVTSNHFGGITSTQIRNNLCDFLENN